MFSRRKKYFLSARNRNRFYRIFFLIFIFNFSFAQDKIVDSLKKVLSGTKEDTVRFNVLMAMHRQYRLAGNFTEGLKYGQQALSLSQKLLSEISPSQKELQRIYKKNTASAYNSCGVIYYSQANYPEGLKYFFKSLELSEQIGDRMRCFSSYNNIGIIYTFQDENEKGLGYFLKAIKIAKEMNDTIQVGNTYGNVGIIYMNKHNYDSALFYFELCLKIKTATNDKPGMLRSYNNRGQVKSYLKKYDEALESFLKGLKIAQETDDREGLANSYSVIGNVMMHLKKFKESKEYLNKSISLATELGTNNDLVFAYETLSSLDSATGNFAGAFKNYKLFLALRDSMLNHEKTKISMRAEMNYEFEKKEAVARTEREKQEAVEKEKSKRQKIITWSVVGILLLVLAFAVFAWRSFLQKQQANKELDEKNKAISVQKAALEEKNTLITDSIEYAKSIQEAVLPNKIFIENLFPESFIFFRPKDVVSGDFYWMKKIPVSENVKHEVILTAVVDCTGHGVPGAFMSLMAFNMLENISVEKNILQPGLILDELNKQVIETLQQKTENTSVKFGMDISLLAFYSGTHQIEFAGAHNPLCIMRNNELIEIKADKTTIGMAKEKFTNHIVPVEKNDMLYLFTDGYADQLGGPQRKKFFISRFKEFLVQIGKENSETQKEKIAANFYEWKNEIDQIDDVLVMGIRC